MANALSAKHVNTDVCCCVLNLPVFVFSTKTSICDAESILLQHTYDNFYVCCPVTV